MAKQLYSNSRQNSIILMLVIVVEIFLSFLVCAFTCFVGTQCVSRCPSAFRKLIYWKILVSVFSYRKNFPTDNNQLLHEFTVLIIKDTFYCNYHCWYFSQKIKFWFIIFFFQYFALLPNLVMAPTAVNWHCIL